MGVGNNSPNQNSGLVTGPSHCTESDRLRHLNLHGLRTFSSVYCERIDVLLNLYSEYFFYAQVWTESVRCRLFGWGRGLRSLCRSDQRVRGNWER